MRKLAIETLNWALLVVMFLYAYGYFPSWPEGVSTFYQIIAWVASAVFMLGIVIIGGLEKDYERTAELRTNLHKKLISESYTYLKILCVTVILLMLHAPIIAAIYFLSGLIAVRLMYSLIKD